MEYSYSTVALKINLGKKMMHKDIAHNISLIYFNKFICAGYIFGVAESANRSVSHIESLKMSCAFIMYNGRKYVKNLVCHNALMSK